MRKKHRRWVCRPTEKRGGPRESRLEREVIFEDEPVPHRHVEDDEIPERELSNEVVVRLRLVRNRISGSRIAIALTGGPDTGATVLLTTEFRPSPDTQPPLQDPLFPPVLHRRPYK
jgi:hypothetical protein